MADTEQTRANLLALSFPDNSTGAITAQNLRDLVVSALGGYGSIYVVAGATPQALSATPSKLTGFAANGPSLGATPDHATDQITIGISADYWVEFTARVSGDAQTYTLRLYKNGAAEGTLLDEMTLDGVVSGKVAFAGPVALAAGDVLAIYGEAGAAANLTLKHAQFAIKRIG